MKGIGGMNWTAYARRHLGVDDAVLAGWGVAACACALLSGGGLIACIWAFGPASALPVGIGAALFNATLLVMHLRLIRRRARSLYAIRAALVAAADGETDPQTLMVSESFGREAIAWNLLLDELQILRQQRAIRLADGRQDSTHGPEDMMRGACDAVWHGIAVVDGELRIQYINGAAAVFFGGMKDTMIGQQLSGLITDPAARMAVVNLRHEAGVGERRAKLVVETPLVAGRDDAIFRLSIRRLVGRDSSIVVIEDVSQQRTADRARNAFVAQATHELRTPLTNIRLCVEALVDSPEMESARRGEHLNVISGEATRLEQLVGDMLCVSEIEAGTMQLARDDMRIDEVLRQAESDFRQQALVKGLNLSFTLGPKLPVLQADREKIILAVGNLIGNALKYTPKGGNVSVTADVKADLLVVEVTDTGLGIAPAEQELIFDRFYRAKDERIASITGTGLGLALARQVVRLHGGDITVSSVIDRGSTFTISLPVAASVALAA